MKRIISAIKFGWYAYRHGHLFQTGLFAMMQEIMEMLVESKEKKIPMRCKMKILDETVMHLWCSTGISPEQRNEQLLIERDHLLKTISELENKLNPKP